MDFTLADHLLQWTFEPWRACDHLGLPRPPKPARKILEANMPFLRDKLRQARRMKLSDPFMRSVFQSTIGQNVDRILARCDLAHLPFDVLWVEYNADVRKDFIANYDPAMESDPDKPVLCGWLMYRADPDDPAIWTAHYYTYDVEGFVSNSHTCYKFGVPMSVEHEMAYHTACAWGFGRRGQPVFIPEAADRASAALDPIIATQLLKVAKYRNKELLAQQALKQLAGYRGDLMLLVSLLAAINYVPIRYRHCVPTGTYRRRFKNIPFMDYREVTIEAGSLRIEQMVDRELEKAEKAHKRAHEVRGHWRHWITAERCVPYDLHRWEGETVKQECARCRTRRSWIETHVRGDASLGWVKHDYEVVRK